MKSHERENRMSDLIDRAEAQTELQFVARRYTVAHEAHGEGKVVWSDNLISVTDAMNVLREISSVQSEIIRCKDCRWNDGTCFCDFHYRDVNPMDYCVWAEGRTDE